MRRVLFHYPIFNVGGAEMSSIRLMRALVDRGWAVTLVLTTGGGLLEPMVDRRVNVVRLRPWQYGRRFKSARGVLAKVRNVPDLLAYCLLFAVGVTRMVPFLFKRYDAAATLLHGTSTWFIRRVVRSNTRIHWIRNDLAQADPTLRALSAISAEYSEIDYYVCVSNVARDSLVRAIPDVAYKAHVIHNLLDAKTIRLRSEKTVDPFPDRRGGEQRVLTVCRLSESPKGLLRMARVCRRLLDADLRFQWFIIGDGPDKALMAAEIRKLRLQSHMILLGYFENPIPAYQHCDVVAVLSNYEGLCGVVNEAKVIGRAVIATRVSGIEEQLVHGETGIIVENNEESIFTGLSSLLANESLRERISVASMPDALMDDIGKLERLEELFLSEGSYCHPSC